MTRFDATMKGFSGGAKTVLDGLNLYWVPGDQIKVFGSEGSYGVYQSTDPETVTAPFTVVSGNAGEAPYRAIYPASCADNEGHLVLPDVQETTDGSLTEYPMYVESDETFLQFDNICGIVRFKLTKANVSVTSIEVTSDRLLNGTFDIAYDDEENVVLRNGRLGTNSITLTCSTAQDISSQHVFDMYMIPGSYSFMRIRIYTSDGHMCIKTLNTGSTFKVECGEINNITLANDNLNFSSLAGELPGLFSIGSGLQAHFSCGNMQYRTQGTHNVVGGTASGTWRFAPNQYDYIGVDNRNISSTYNGWIDLFGWGTSGWYSSVHGSNDYYYYQPYNWEGGSGLYYGPGNNDIAGVVYANADWAVYNAISNGGNQSGMWRTLSREEWMYVTTNRDGAVSKRGSGLVNGVGGLILLPDEWNLPDGCRFTAAFSEAQDEWNPNNYTLAQWAKMEAAGAIFLPAAGYRSGVNVSFVGQKGGYWSSSHINTFSAWGPYILSVKPEGAGSDYDYNYGRQTGLSVRPVRVITTSQQ